MKNNTVKMKIKNPFTQKNMETIYIDGKGLFRWNTAFHVYNSVTNYEQMKYEDIHNINYKKSK